MAGDLVEAIQFELNLAVEFSDYDRAEKLQAVLDFIRLSEVELTLLRSEKAELVEARDNWRDVAMRLASPKPVSDDIAVVVASIEEWVNRRGGDETVDQIAVMAIEAYKRAALSRVSGGEP